MMYDKTVPYSSCSWLTVMLLLMKTKEMTLDLGATVVNYCTTVFETSTSYFFKVLLFWLEGSHQHTMSEMIDTF